MPYQIVVHFPIGQRNTRKTGMLFLRKQEGDADNLIKRQFQASKPYEKFYRDGFTRNLPPIPDDYNSEIIRFETQPDNACGGI